MQKGLNRSNNEFNFLATNLFENYFSNDTNGPPYKRDIIYNPALQCTEQEGWGALVQNDYPPQG